jgi:hypothetical protein
LKKLTKSIPFKRDNSSVLQYISEERKDEEDSSSLNSDYEGGKDNKTIKAQQDRMVVYTNDSNIIDSDANIS